MICPECAQEDRKSKVTPGITSSTLLYCAPFYDENGIQHHHDYNTHTQVYTCSNGHKWETRIVRGCLDPTCDFKGSSKTIIHCIPDPATTNGD